MITNNVLQRVFNIKYGNGIGSCFIIEVDNRQYVVTAKHVVEGLQDDQTISLHHNNNWIDYQVKLVGHSLDADVSVFTLPIGFNRHQMLATSNGLTLTQEVFFLGYPYGLWTNIGALNEDYPLPFVKKGIVSYLEFNNGLKKIFLDGQNNPGFSGGPAVFKALDEANYNVFGIISAYRSENISVQMNGQNTVFSVPVNTGIVITYSIDCALSLIHQNPIGFNLEA